MRAGPDGFLTSMADLPGPDARDDITSESIPTPMAAFRMAAGLIFVDMDSSSYAGVGSRVVWIWAGSSDGGGCGGGGGGDRRGRLAVGDDGAVMSMACFGGNGYRFAWLGIGASIKLAIDGDARALV